MFNTMLELPVHQQLQLQHAKQNCSKLGELYYGVQFNHLVTYTVPNAENQEHRREKDLHD
jgi:hypothetical protein